MSIKNLSALFLFILIALGNSNISLAATRIASYTFDESNWEATSTVNDTVGGNNGSVSGAVSRIDSTSSNAHSNTCSGASFSGGYIDITGLPVSTNKNAKTSVSFWMYWDGTDSVMPLGWEKHGLWLSNGSFGFNSWGNDIYGISSSGLANGWHHVVAVFTNGKYKSNQLYIDGVKQKLSLRQGSFNSSNAVVNAHMQIGGVWGSSGYKFQGRIDEVNVYNGQLSQAEVNADFNYVTSGACAAGPGPQAPTLIASYDFNDEWSASQPLTDLVGSADGTVSGAVTRVLSPPAGAKPETCAAGDFAGGAIDIYGLPVSTSSGDVTSVSFWMYWDGTNSVMPLGWRLHDLWFYGGSFGFNSAGGDIYGISSSGLANGWHHVVAVFTNNNIGANKLYIDGVLQTLTQRRGSKNNGNAVVNPHLRMGGWWYNNGYRFRGQLDEFKVYTGEITQTMVNADLAAASPCATPVASWLMDESNWSGTANEVADSSGNNHSGTSYNGAATEGTTPAIPGDPGTCGYGRFDGSNDYVEIPHSNSLNGSAALTYMAWVNADRWTGTRQIMAKSVHGGGSGRAQMGLFSESNKFWGRAETHGGRKDVQISLPSTNTWHHIALVFSGTDLVLYVDGAVAGSTSFGSTTLVANTDPVNISKRVGSNQYFFDGAIDEVRIYTEALSQFQVQQAMADTHACPSGGGGDTAATNFNCVEVGADPIAGKLWTKTTAQSFNFDVVALQNATTVETGFASGVDHTVNVELVDANTGDGSCGNFSAVSPAVSQSLVFSAADAGVKSSANMTSTTAYRAVKCRVTDPTDTPSVVGCSTDSFSIRPTAFGSVTSNMTNAGSSGGPVAKAGDAFTLTATATAGYDGAPQIDNTRLQAHVGAIQTGSMSGSFGAANAGTGVATGSSFVYSEVGNVQFLAQGVYDSTFTSVDQPGDCTADFSNTPVGGKVGCSFGNPTNSAYFGRFTPDHFTVSATQNGSIQAVCNGFAYSGESFGYVSGDEPGFTVTAENGLSTPTTTQNYTGAYNKLNVVGFAIALTEDASNLGADGLNRLAIAWSPGANLSDNGDGTMGFDLAGDSFSYTKNANAEVAPVSSDIDLVFTEIRDGDNVLANAMPLTLQPAGIGIRFGRLAMDNAYGSELMTLPVPLRAEHYGGQSVGYVSNTLDQCTSIQASDMTLSSAVESGQVDGDVQVLAGQTSQATIVNLPFVSGSAGLSFCPPGSPACTPTTGNTGYIDIITSAPTHLQFDWDNDGAYDDDPSARANFGLFSGHDKQIYLREVY